MKISTLIIFLLFVTSSAWSQDVDGGLEKRMFGAQVGLWGIYGHYEYQVSQNSTLRSEAGLDLSLSGSGNDWYYFLAPMLALEPRWYYSMNRRVTNGRNTQNNSANYCSVQLRFHPEMAIITNAGSGQVVPDLSIIPNWGLRRSFGQHLNMEFASGFGWMWTFYEYKTDSELAFNLTLRLGLDF